MEGAGGKVGGWDLRVGIGPPAICSSSSATQGIADLGGSMDPGPNDRRKLNKRLS